MVFERHAEMVSSVDAGVVPREQPPGGSGLVRACKSSAVPGGAPAANEATPPHTKSAAVRAGTLRDETPEARIRQVPPSEATWQLLTWIKRYSQYNCDPRNNGPIGHPSADWTG